MLNTKLFRPAHKKNLQIARERLQSLCLGATLNDILSNSVRIVYEPDDRYRCSYWLTKHKLLTRRGLILSHVTIRISTLYKPVYYQQLDNVVHIGSEIWSLLKPDPGVV